MISFGHFENVLRVLGSRSSRKPHTVGKQSESQTVRAQVTPSSDPLSELLECEICRNTHWCREMAMLRVAVTQMQEESNHIQAREQHTRHLAMHDG